MRNLSLSEHWYQLMSKPDGCGGRRISKLKIYFSMVSVIIIVSIIIFVISIIDSTQLPADAQSIILLLQSLSSNPIIFSVLIILIFIAFCCSGFTVAQIGKMECSLLDGEGNTLMDEIKTLHSKVDSFTSEYYSQMSGDNYQFKGDNTNKGYNLDEVKAKWKSKKKN